MNQLIEYLKKNWQQAAFIGGIVLLVVSTGAVLLLASMRRERVGNEPAPPANVSLPVPVVRTYTDLYAVSIDNHVDARPVSGVDKAAIVYEMPVEGDITRFLAFFERGTQVKQIGPVRSARLYLLDWVVQYGAAFFFHFGGSPEALDKIASTPALQRINEDGMGSAGALYWRDTKQYAPHNAYISSDSADKAFDARIGEERKVDAWLMANEPDASARGEDGASVNVPISNLAAYRPVWVYDQAENIYRRTVNDKEEKNSDGTVIAAKNIIIMRTALSVIDAVGRLKIATTGRGEATVYRNGKSEEAIWVGNGDNTMPARFYGSDGAEIVLTSGNVWIEVVKK